VIDDDLVKCVSVAAKEFEALPPLPDGETEDVSFGESVITDIVAEGVAVAHDVCDTEADVQLENDTKGDIVGLNVAVPDPVLEIVTVPEVEEEAQNVIPETDCDALAQTVTVAEVEEDVQRLSVPVPELLPVAVTDREPASEGLEEDEDVVVIVSEGLSEFETVFETVTAPVRVADADDEALDEKVPDGEELAENVTLALREPDGVTVDDPVILGLCVAEPVPLLEDDARGEREGEPELDGVFEMDFDAKGDIDVQADDVPEGDRRVDSDSEALPELLVVTRALDCVTVTEAEVSGVADDELRALADGRTTETEASTDCDGETVGLDDTPEVSVAADWEASSD
jgi:hypothetical protein